MDAMGENGELSITIKASNDHACASIKDNGHGISPKDLPHLFEAFFTTKAAGHGSGLGLAVAKTITEEHGGSIFAKSAHGEGSTFIICIPSISYDGEENTTDRCCDCFE
jgi:signal transduction histidine kinase